MTESGKKNMMPTGIPGLDRLLEGGILRGNSLLIEGPPGSGKTTMGIRVIHNGIVQYDEPGLLISFEEIPRQVYNEAKGYGIDLEYLESTGKFRIIWTTPQRIIEGFSGKNDLIDKIIEELHVKRILIDSLTHFKRIASSEQHMRDLLANLMNYLKLKDINVLLVKELERMDDQIIAFEEYLVDSSLRLYNSQSTSGGENQRFVEIRKTRGQGHISGRHPLILGHTDDGIQVFPQLRPEDIQSIFPKKTGISNIRVSSGNPKLDSMLFGGFYRGALNLLNGCPGSGKSVIAGQFLDDGLKRGETVLMVTGKGTSQKIIHQMASIGLNWKEALNDSRLQILNFQSNNSCVESIISNLINYFSRYNISRLVFDSLDDIWSLVRDESRFRNYVRLLATLFESTGATSLVLKETQNMGGLDGDEHLAVLASCVMQLSMSENDGNIHRFISIKKHAGSNHAKELMEIQIDAKGCHIMDKASGLSGILTGNAQGSLSRISLGVVDALEELTNIFYDIIDSKKLPPDAHEQIQNGWKSLSKLDILLKEHFGISNFKEITESETDSEPVDESIYIIK
jgi:circadian clock protein KaiC